MEHDLFGKPVPLFRIMALGGGRRRREAIGRTATRRAGRAGRARELVGFHFRHAIKASDEAEIVLFGEIREPVCEVKQDRHSALPLLPKQSRRENTTTFSRDETTTKSAAAGCNAASTRYCRRQSVKTTLSRPTETPGNACIWPLFIAFRIISMRICSGNDLTGRAALPMFPTP